MPLLLEFLLIWLTIFTMLVGLIGLIVPIFPGNVVIWVAALVFGLITGFGTLGWWMFAFITLLMLVAATADNVLMGAKARAEGAAWSSIILASVSGVIGTIIFPPLGGLIAAPLVLFGLETRRLKDSKQALRITRSMLIGLGLSFVVRFGIGVLMIVLWGIWVFFK